jgi:membrane protease YdiL (CAAX protease family)
LATALGPLGLKRALVLAVASGIAEEMFFRGALQPRVGLGIASVLFAAAHFLPRRILLPWTAFALIAGFILGGLFEWTGNLVAPVTAHIVVNAINLPLLEYYFGKASRGS